MMLEPSDKPKYIQVYEMFQAGFSRKEIKVFTGLSAHTVASYITRGRNPERFREIVRAQNAKYKKGPRRTTWNTFKGWTEAQLEARITELWNEGFSSGVIANMFPFRGVFTRSAIIGKLNRMGLVGLGKPKPKVKTGHALSPHRELEVEL